MLETESIERPVPRLTDATKQHYAGKTRELQGMYKLCVATDGSVVNVKTLAPVPESNDGIVATLQQWKFRPQPIPVCSLVRLVFDLAPPPPTAVPDPSYREVSEAEAGPEQTGGTLRMVRGRGGVGVYEVYVDTDGGVRRVDVVVSAREADEGIVASIKRWHFPPRPDRVRFQMRFDLGH